MGLCCVGTLSTPLNTLRRAERGSVMLKPVGVGTMLAPSALMLIPARWRASNNSPEGLHAGMKEIYIPQLFPMMFWKNVAKVGTPQFNIPLVQ